MRTKERQEQQKTIKKHVIKLEAFYEEYALRRLFRVEYEILIVLLLLDLSKREYMQYGDKPLKYFSVAINADLKKLKIRKISENRLLKIMKLMINNNLLQYEVDSKNFFSIDESTKYLNNLIEKRYDKLAENYYEKYHNRERNNTND